MRGLACAILLAGLCGCGHSFNSRTDANLIPNPYFSDRDFVEAGVPETGDAIGEWCARIAYWDGDHYFILTVPYFATANRPQVQAVQKKYMYSTVIDKNWEGHAVFPFVSADATGETSTEVSMVDVATVLVPGPDEPRRGDAFDQEAKARGIADPAKVPLFWIKGVALASLSTKQASKVTARATINGDGFGINGADYDSVTTASFSPLVSVYALPMNDLADAQMKENRAAREKLREGKNVQPGPGPLVPKAMETLPGLTRNSSGLVPIKFQSDK